MRENLLWIEIWQTLPLSWILLTWNKDSQLFVIFRYSLDLWKSCNGSEKHAMFVGPKLFLLCFSAATLNFKLSAALKQKLKNNFTFTQSISLVNRSEILLQDLLDEVIQEIHPRQVVIWDYIYEKTDWKNIFYRKFSNYLPDVVRDIAYHRKSSAATDEYPGYMRSSLNILLCWERLSLSKLQNMILQHLKLQRLLTLLSPLSKSLIFIFGNGIRLNKAQQRVIKIY